MPADLTVSALVDLLMSKATAAEIRAVISAASAAQGAKADSALQPNGNGSALTGITAAQVGALAPNGNGSGLTGITATQVGALAPDGDGSLLTNMSRDQVGLEVIDPSHTNPFDVQMGTPLTGDTYERRGLDEVKNIVMGGVMNARTGTTETASGADYYVGTTMDNAAAQTYTVPVDSAFSPPFRDPVEGTTIQIYSLGVGLVTIVPAASVTILSRDDAFTLFGKNSGAAIVHLAAANTWLLVGDLTP